VRRSFIDTLLNRVVIHLHDSLLIAASSRAPFFYPRVIRSQENGAFEGVLASGGIAARSYKVGVRAGPTPRNGVNKFVFLRAIKKAAGLG
jgi:hypothetical protein